MGSGSYVGVIALLFAVVFFPLILVWGARSKGHLKRSSRAVDTVSDWSFWLTIILAYAVAPLALVYIFRLARPTSWWAEHFYDSDKLERSREVYWTDTSSLLTSADLTSKGPIREAFVLGLDRDQVDQFIERSIAVVRAYEGDRPDRVAVPQDLLAKPKFARTYRGCNDSEVDDRVTECRDTIAQLSWLHQSRPWLLRQSPQRPN